MGRLIAAITALVLIASVACDGESREERIDHWAEELSVSTMEEAPWLCTPPGDRWFGTSSEVWDEIPEEDRAEVSDLAIEKLEQRCRETHP